MWERLPHTKTVDLFRMTLFYIELRILSNVRENGTQRYGNSIENKINLNEHSFHQHIFRFFDNQTIQHFHNLLCMKSLLIIDCDALLEIRFNLLHFQLAIELEEFELATDLLSHIETIFTNGANYIQIIRFPNQMYCSIVDLWIIANEKELLECLRLQKIVVQYISAAQYDDVAAILLKYQKHNFESSQFRSVHQMEILLESLWQANRFEECLQWCERGLYHSVCAWLQCESKDQLFEQFPRHIHFLTTYLNHLLDDNSLCKCLTFFNFKCLNWNVSKWFRIRSDAR